MSTPARRAMVFLLWNWKVCDRICARAFPRGVPHEWDLDPALYVLSYLALALLVTRVLADHHHIAVTTNDFALVAHGLNAGTYLHGLSLLSRWPRAPVVPGAVPSQCLLVAVDDAA